MNIRAKNPTGYETEIGFTAKSGDTTFPFPWWIRREEAITVSKDGAELTIGTDYVIPPLSIQNSSGGGIVLSTPTAGGEKIVIIVNHTIEDIVSFIVQGEIRAETLNLQHRYFVQLFREIKAHIGGSGGGSIDTQFKRTVQINKKDPTPSEAITLPDISVRSNRFLAFDATGRPIAREGTGSTPIPVELNMFWDKVEAPIKLGDLLNYVYTGLGFPDGGLITLPDAIPKNDGVDIYIANPNTNTASITVTSGDPAITIDGSPNSVSIPSGVCERFVLDLDGSNWFTDYRFPSRFSAETKNIVTGMADFLTQLQGQLKTAAFRDAGTAPDQIPFVDSSGKLPASVIPDSNKPTPDPSKQVKKIHGSRCATSKGTYVFEMMDGTFRLSQIGISSSLFLRGSLNNLGHLHPPQLETGETITQVEAAGYGLFMVTSRGNVYACGENLYNTLGLNDTYKFYPEFTKIKFPGDPAIREVVVPLPRSDQGNTYFIAVNGDLYATGYNNCGQLGTGDTTNYFTPIKVSVVSNVKELKCFSAYAGQTNAQGVNCYCITDDGVSPPKLYVWGNNFRSDLGTLSPIGLYYIPTPTLITSFTPKATGDAISTAYKGRILGGAKSETTAMVFVVATTPDPNVDTIWFAGQPGQGIDGVNIDYSTLTVWTQDAQSVSGNKKIRKTDFMSEYSASYQPNQDISTYIITEDNRVFFRGNNKNGNLGIVSKTSINHIPTEPIQIADNIQGRIARCEGNGLVTYLLTTDGKVYSCGYSKEGALGFLENSVKQGGDLIDTSVFRRVNLNKKVVDIKISYYTGQFSTLLLHTVFLLCDDGDVYVFGIDETKNNSKLYPCNTALTILNKICLPSKLIF